MKNINSITNPLERRRVQLGYSQQDISILLGITQSQYSRIEKGNSDPNKHLNYFSCLNKLYLGLHINQNILIRHS